MTRRKRYRGFLSGSIGRKEDWKTGKNAPRGVSWRFLWKKKGVSGRRPCSREKQKLASTSKKAGGNGEGKGGGGGKTMTQAVLRNNSVGDKRFKLRPNRISSREGGGERF